MRRLYRSCQSSNGSSKLTYLNIKSNEVKEKICQLVSVIGKVFVGDVIGEEYNTLQSCYKDASYMSSLHPRDFLNDRNKVLMSFLRSIVPSTRHYSHQLAMIVESIYHLKNNNLILPHSFLANLIQTFISGSKTVTTINGKIIAGGSDTSYRKWLNDNAKPLTYPSHDSDIYIDNVGKYINKSYRVSYVKNASPTVVTACIDIPLTNPNDAISGLQQKPELKPGTWGEGATEEEIQVLMEQKIQEGIEDFRGCRYNYLGQIIKFLASSRDMEKKINEEMEWLSKIVMRVCENPLCKEEYANNKRKCDLCQSKVYKESENPEIDDLDCTSILPKYLEVGETLISNHVDIKMLETILVNPNSYINLEKIIHKEVI